MFRETIETWGTSVQERSDLLDFAKSLHNDLMDVKYVGSLLNNSVVKSVEIDLRGIYITVERNGYSFKLYVNEEDFGDVSITALCKRDYETEETNMVFRLLQYYAGVEGFVMLDVGANVGWYSLNAIKQMPGMELYAFEPSPVTYQRLVNNFKLNGINADGAYNLGFYNTTGKLDFYYDRTRSGASSLMNIQEKESIEKISVDMMKMDDWAKDNHIDKVDFIKCDVEGSELFVYEGGMELIKKSRPIIFSEMLRKWSAKFGYHPNDIIHLLATIGYECFVIGEAGKLKKFGLVDEETIETNYFFLHADKHLQIIQDLC